MDKNEKWLEWAVELQALGQAGMHYTDNKFDLERFERIREIAVEMLEYKTEISKEKIKDLFMNERGYQTPKLDCRAAIFKNDKLLLVQESDGRWAMPGGWCDVHLSVGQNTIKEAKEEAGLDVEIVRVAAILDRDMHNFPILAHKITKIFSICKPISGHFVANSETLDAAYFDLSNLPNLSSDKTSLDQVKLCFDAYNDENWKVVIE